MILERYLHREILGKIGWMIGLLLLIVASNRFVGFLADAAAGKLPSDLIVQMLVMKMLASLPKLLPIALFLAILLAIARMARDRELVIYSVAGAGERYQMFAVTRFAAIYAVLIAAVSFYLAPWAERHIGQLKLRAAAESDVSGVVPGQFREFSEGERVVYVEGMSEDRLRMQEIFLQVRQHKRLGVLNSRSARYTADPDSGARYVLFENGRRYVGRPGTLNYQVTNYREYGVLLERGDPDAAAAQLESLPTATLFGSSDAMHRAELQWRLSSILAGLLLPLLGVALNRFSFNDNRYAPIFIAIFTYFIYSNLLGISKTLLKRDQIPAVVGLWWVHLMLALIIAAILLFPAWRRRRARRGTVQVLPAS
jgi:lipopolysaccharide export system permease protein